jgi:acyl-CoA thioesterase-1
MRAISLTAALFVSLALTSCHARELRIMPLGASITAGLTVTQDGTHVFEGGYRRYLETSLEGLFQTPGLDFDFVGSQEDPATASLKRKHHEGHPGWRIDNIDEQAAGWVSAYQPDAILLLVGTNDILQNYHLEEAPDRLDQLVGHLVNSKPVQWVFVSSLLPLADPALDAEAQAYDTAIERKVLARQAQGQSVVWVDMYHESGVKIEELGDGIHPGAEGYEKMAPVWYRAIARTLTQAER